MFETFPNDYTLIKDWEWDNFAPYAEYLRRYELNEATIKDWLCYKTNFFALLEEYRTRLNLKLDGNIAYPEHALRLNRFDHDIQPEVDTLWQELGQKLLASDIRLANYEVPLRHLRADIFASSYDTAETKREIHQLRQTYQQILASQTIDDIPLRQLELKMNTPDRAERERLYHQIQARRTEDKMHFDSIWTQLLMTRQQMMNQANADNFRDLRWRQLKRFDYAPRDVMAFCSAIERVVVPLRQRRHEGLANYLKVESLRAWDLPYNPAQKNLKPYLSTPDLLNRLQKLFLQIHPEFGAHFKTMREENLLDLETRPRKSPVSYVVDLPHSKQPYIFWTLAGTSADVEGLIHECGHAFHVFESAKWEYAEQRAPTIEMGEMSAMTLEFLALEHYDIFYDEADIPYARVRFLEKKLNHWVESAIFATFQHWVYSHHRAATDPACCDAKWRELLLRYYPALDFRGLEQQMLAPWWHHYRIFFEPFYAIEFAIAQLGAVQIWQKSRKKRHEAIRDFRSALALGNTKPLPDLFNAAGATLAFDEATLQQAVDAIEMEIITLESAL